MVLDLINKQKDNFLHNLYYEKKFFVGRDKLWDYTYNTLDRKDISRRYIAGWLAHQPVNQLYTQRKKETSIRPIVSKQQGALLQLDLQDFSKNKSKTGDSYVLNVIDVFSRKCWLAPIRYKAQDNVLRALNPILEEIQKDHKISIIKTDRGKEFDIEFYNNIKHLKGIAYVPQGQGHVERSNRSLKTILFKILFEKKLKWTKEDIKVVEDVYNNTINRVIKMTPNEAYVIQGKDKDDLIERQNTSNAKKYKEVDKVLELGNRVRLVIEKDNPLIKKKGLPIWSKEIYTISKVIKGNAKTFSINRYKLTGEKGEVLNGTFPLSKLLLIPN